MLFKLVCNLFNFFLLTSLRIYLFFFYFLLLLLILFTYYYLFLVLHKPKPFFFLHLILPYLNYTHTNNLHNLVRKLHIIKIIKKKLNVRVVQISYYDFTTYEKYAL